MPDLHAMVPGSMPMGWLKKISALEEQNRLRQREIQALVERVKKLEQPVAGFHPNAVGDLSAEVMASTPLPIAIPVKRGPGRPRKNPQ